MNPEGEQAENQQAENQQAENQQAPAAASAMATSAASINSQVPLPPNYVTTGDLAFNGISINKSGTVLR